MHVGSVVEHWSAVVHAVGTIQLVGEFLDFLGAVLSLGQVQREPEVSAADFGSLIKVINFVDFGIIDSYFI